MKCPAGDELSKYARGGTSQNARAALDAHLAHCDSCRFAVDRIAEVIFGEMRRRLANISVTMSQSPDFAAEADFIQRLKDNPPDWIASLVNADRRKTADPVKFPFPPTERGPLGQLDGYHIAEMIGKGGFAEVFKAWDEDLHRWVAIKVIRFGVDWARFEREVRAACAVVDDHVVRVYHVGDRTSLNFPYFVMEFVEGESLSARLHRDKILSPREAATCARQIAWGLESASHRDLVHRDIKPSNILLDSRDGRAKITDFGLARAFQGNQTLGVLWNPSAAVPAIELTIGDHATDSSGAVDVSAQETQSGVAQGPQADISTPATHAVGVDIASAGVSATSQLAGTLPYMSPEQIDSPDQLNVRSDIYGLGVVLFEMLTGRLPFLETNRQKLVAQIRSDMPPFPRTLVASIPSDLQAITLKCLEKKPDLRYKTARDLADDLDRFLKGEPTTARPVGWPVLVGMWTRRNPLTATLAAASILAMLTAFGGVAYGWQRAARERDNLEESVRGMFDLAATYFDKAAMTADLGTKRAAVQDYEGAIRIYRRLLELRPHDPELLEKAAAAYHNLGNLYTDLGQLDAAMGSLKSCLEYRNRIVAEFPDRPNGERNLAMCLGAIGKVHREAGRLADAEQYYLQGRRKLDAHLAVHAADYEALASLAGAFRNLGNVYLDRGEIDEGVRACEAAIAHIRTLIEREPNQPDHRNDLAQTSNSLAIVLKRLNRLDEAEKTFNEARDTLRDLAERYPAIRQYQNALAMIHNNIALLLERRGDTAGATAEYQRAIEIRERLCRLDPSDPGFKSGLANNLVMLASLQEESGNTDTALQRAARARMLLDSIVRAPDFVPEIQGRISRSYAEVGKILLRLGRMDESEASYREAIVISERIVQTVPDDVGFAVTLAADYGNFAHVLTETARLDEALEYYERARDLQVRTLQKLPTIPRYISELATTFESIGNLRSRQRKLDTAMESYLRCEEFRERLVREHPDDPKHQRDLASVRHNMATITATPQEALQLYERAKAFRQKLAEMHPENTAYQDDLGTTLLCIGELLARTGRRDEAIDQYIRAEEYLRVAHERAPAINQHRVRLLLVQSKHAALLVEMQRFADAVSVWTEAMESAQGRSLVRVRFDRAYGLVQMGDAPAAIAEVRETLPQLEAGPDDIYNAACVYSLAIVQVHRDNALDSTERESRVEQYGRQAVALLRQAVAKGFDDVALVRKDQDLDSLRQRQDFQAFLGEIEQANQSRSK